MCQKPRPFFSSQSLRVNARHIRAQRVTAHLMHALDRILDQADPDLDLHRRVSREITELLTTDGVEVFTDYDRQEIGLPPRGPDGWTVTEMHALENKRLEALISPMPHFIVREPK